MTYQCFEFIAYSSVILLAISGGCIVAAWIERLMR